MIIYPSKIISQGNSCIIKTPFELKGIKNDIWYKLPTEYKDYVVSENQDAALVALLALAMMNEEDIYVEGQVSTKLFYTINTYLIRALNLSDKKYKIIKVEAEKLNDQSFTTHKAAATGISCGVDSLSTIATHINLENDYRIKYLTYFKAGAHGVYGGTIANQIFERGLQHATAFANENNLPIIVVESNIMDVLKINFQSLHTLIHLSCILNLQKLVSIYYYASSFRFDYYELDGFNSSWDILILDLIETESLNFYSSASQYTRFERTEIVANYEPSYKFLDVCLEPINASLINCSKCEKCVRTLLSLEMIGKIDNYKNIFDLQTYYANKDQYIGELLINKNLNQTNKEIYFKLKQNDLIKIKHYILLISLFFSIKIKFLKKHFIKI